MKFGPVPLDQAEGAILAHSVATPQGRLRKGQWIGAQEMARLRAAGLTEVIVARPEPGEIHEDAAATRLAQALVPDPEAAGLTLTRATTGRVNLLAADPGVVELDAPRLTALNRIDPMITLATVPRHQQMDAGRMVATIKIIPYAVSGASLDAAEVLLEGHRTLQLHRPVLKTAALVVTEIPGGAGEAGLPAIRDRLAALDMTLDHVETVAHRRDPLAQALGDLRDADRYDLILVLTASATSDPGDVVPAAIREAGGTVERFGMPVDPGNLLVLGRLRGRDVIGLPGCARSPALNGADWVLARLACGIATGDAEIAAMGVGGLLKEIPTRPHPRRRGS